jgi:hypothetical protein
MKYRDSLDGVSVENYLYSTASKLAVIKNFRDEAFSQLKMKSPDEVRGSPICHIKDFTNTDQFKYGYKLSNLPMNPTALN